MLLHHALPCARIAVLEREALGVGAVGEQYRILAVFDGAEYVGAHLQAVIHRDRHVPIDAHAVAGLAAFSHSYSLPERGYFSSPRKRGEVKEKAAFIV